MDVCRPVYEAVPGGAEPCSGENAADKRLVMTPWMLLDGLKELEEEAERLLCLVRENNLGWERRCGVPVNPLADTAERLQFGAAHLLRLLWRGGLWTNDEITPMSDADGETFHVLRAPFTDGKPNGRPLPPDAPRWQRDLLGAVPQDRSAACAGAAPRLAPEKIDMDLADPLEEVLASTIHSDRPAVMC